MTIRDIAVSFGFDVDQSSISAVEKSINGLKSMAKTALGAIGIAFTISGIADLAEAAANAEATASQFTQVFGEMESQASDSLSKIADDTGIVENRMKASYTQIAAFAKTTGMATADALGLTDRSMKAVADSAAFYDRSLEEVTDSIQSFLKGNYENDAALGLSCTETTRNTAANALYGKSFKDLAEDQKQLTLLQMVEDANKLSGALGQAARESDTWTNQMGNFQQSITDLKVAVGKTFLKPAVGALKLFSSIIQSIAKQVPKITSGFGDLANRMFGVTDGQNNLIRAFRNILASVKVLKPAIDRMMQSISVGAGRSADFIGSVIDQLGGIENALKLLALVAGAFFIAVNWSSIVQEAGKLLQMITGISRIFSLANLKILAVVAIIVLLALVVEDFINFLSGNNSVIGTIFDKAGIGADNAREAIFNAWNNIKDFLLGIWDFIKQAAGMFADTVKELLVKNSDSIKSNFERAWGLIKKFLIGVWTFISQLATTLFGGMEENIEGSATSTKDKLLSVWQSILNMMSAIFNALYKAGSAVFNAFATLIEFIFLGIQTFWNSWGSQILSWFRTVFDSIGGILNGFLTVIMGIADFISSVFTGNWEAAWEAVKQIFFGIWNMILSFITAVWETIKLLFSMGLSAVSAIWNSIWSAISSFFIGIWNGIVSFLQGAWASITSTISGAINGAYNTIVSVLTSIQSFFNTTFSAIATFISEIFTNILNGIITSVTGIKDAIVNGFTVAIDWIKGLPAQAVTWGLDFMNGLKNGIMSGVNGIVDSVKGVAEKIKSYLHFSVPDVGPLTDYESWMPDFMAGLGKGIEGNEHLVLDRVRNLASGIATLSQAATVKAQTATNSSVRNSSMSVIQNNDFNNSYYGGDAQIQQNASKAMNRSSNDATSQLAKGLAYAR